jgi:hypothetical protein
MEFRFSISSSGGPAVSANTWSTTSTPKSTGAVDLASNSGATWYVTGVQLEKGTTASSFEFRSYTTELQLCQRYYWKSNAASASSMRVLGGAPASTNIYVSHAFSFPVTMRSTPTVTKYGTWSVTNCTQPTTHAPDMHGFGLYVLSTSGSIQNIQADTVNSTTYVDATIEL